MHYNLWLTQRALINGYEANVWIYCMNIEMKKLVISN